MTEEQALAKLQDIMDYMPKGFTYTRRCTLCGARQTMPIKADRRLSADQNQLAVLIVDEKKRIESLLEQVGWRIEGEAAVCADCVASYRAGVELCQDCEQPRLNRVCSFCGARPMCAKSNQACCQCQKALKKEYEELYARTEI